MERDHRCIVLMCMASLAGCHRPNPAFDGDTLAGTTGEGDGDTEMESSDSDTDEPSTTDTDEPSTATDEPSTDTDEPGDGDGDGDEEPGDGDGEPVEECFVEAFEPAGDTFFQAGPNEPSGCRFGWQGPWGPVNANCNGLNFGETPVHWVGLKSESLNNLEGPSFYAFKPPDVDVPPDYEIVGLGVVIHVDLLEPGMPGSVLRLQTISSGEANSWYAGDYDGELAQSGTFASTYGYRIPEDAPWPGVAFHNALDETLLNAGLQGQLGGQGFEFWFAPGVAESFSISPGKYANGFALTSIGLDGFDVLVSSLEAEPAQRPFFLVELCPL